MDDDRAPQPTKLVEGKSKSDAGNLQAKMKAAANAFGDQIFDVLDLRFEPVNKQRALDLYIFDSLSPYISCTPEAVFYLYRGQWIRLTEENVQCSLGSTKALEDLRKYAKKFGRVSWVLPKLQEGGAE